MPLFAHTGPPDDELLRQLQSLVAHRGVATAGDGVGGEHLDGPLAWAGVVRGDRPTPETAIASGDPFDGEFVMAVRDGDDLVVRRDAAGNRSVYYGRLSDGRWAVSCEPGGVRGLPSFKGRVRPAAVAQFLAFSFVPGVSTMSHDLYELPPGHRVRLRTGEPPGLTVDFDPLSVEPDDSDPAEWPARFRRLLEREVAERLRPDESPVVFLSGGLDSSIVAAELARQASRPVRTFALHFGAKLPNELTYARAVAERLGTVHTEVEITPRQAVRRFEEIVRRLGEPVGDPVTMPNFELAGHVARLGVDRVWNGEGGDPLFGGPKSLPMLIGDWYPGTGTRERRYLASYRRAWDELGRLPGRNVRGRFDVSDDLESLITPFLAGDGPLLHKLLAINTRLKGGHLILPKVERMLAAHGVAPLSPLFTRSMVELAFASPPKAKLQAGVDKWLMREAFRDDLPDAVLSRPKSGMRVPVHHWFRGPLRRFARRTLRRNRIELAGMLDPARVAALTRYEPTEGPGRHGLKVWMLLTLQTWWQENGRPPSA